jgi:hypothetical protein
MVVVQNNQLNNHQSLHKFLMDRNKPQHNNPLHHQIILVQLSQMVFMDVNVADSSLSVLHKKPMILSALKIMPLTLKA